MSKEIENLRNTVIVLIQKVDSFTKENESLKKRLSKYETSKNSNNSSIPPSKDENRPKRKSLREKSGLKAGGQKGRKGKTLKMVKVPDFTNEYHPEYSNCCGKNLSDIGSILVGRRQVYDVPPIEIKVTEHRVYERLCSCGHKTRPSWPTGIKDPCKLWEQYRKPHRLFSYKTIYSV